MEEMLDTYAEPYDKRFPVLCMDEQPVPLTKEKRVPVPATKKHPRRVDYEYERAGTASILCQGWSTWSTPWSTGVSFASPFISMT
jgi:hypothetical protein